MHIALGKRQSGCDLNAQLPAGGAGFMPMVGMMQSFGGGWSSFITSLIFTLLLWLLILTGIIVLIRWLIGGGRMEEKNTALELLRKRYAKGEISKKILRE